ncbi:fused MFS/spermidine synthase [Patulibacter sp. SYSU D01012]|uniref:spermidine synthase n=1 Tax=Patulibacter sp. SYSU D01012 TaxID=2817381 RepID=UPI001FF067D2|nr:fused MFS/spermidine synthase [Patulibacter sp. SYSU D01012]
MRALTVLVFVVGAGSLGAEMAAARLLAPYFGDSTIIWANTIGVCLIALAVGHWLGGRFADRHPHLTGLRVLVLIAAALLAVVPLVAGPFLDLAIEAFDRIEAGAFVGSLLGMLVLIALPLVLIGAATPWATKLAVTDLETTGSTVGRLGALGTAGSLVGTFVSSLLLIPFVGSQRTFIVLALAMALVAAVGLRRRLWVVPALIAAALLLPPGVTKPAQADDRVLDEAETLYQYARVIEHPVRDGTGAPVVERRLELNEGQAIHSVWRKDTVLTGNYWDAFQVLPFAVADPARGDAPTAPPRSIAMLGNAGGTVARAALRFFPQVRFDGVEIDGRVSEMGRRWLGMPDDPRLRVHTADARPFLRSGGAGDGEGRYDLIGVDAYRQPYIPFYLTTKEFFGEVRDRLTPRGAVVVNIGHPEGDDALERALTATMRTHFPSVVRWPVTATNTLVLGTTSRASAARLRAAVPTLPAELRPVAEAAAAELGGPLGGGPVYTDDRAPVEWLIDGSIVSYATK